MFFIGWDLWVFPCKKKGDQVKEVIETWRTHLVCGWYVESHSVLLAIPPVARFTSVPFSSSGLLTKESENLLCTLGRGWEGTAAGVGSYVTACTRRGLVLPSGIHEQCHRDLKPKRSRAGMKMRDGVDRDTSSLSELPLFPPGPGFPPPLEGHTDRSSDLALLLALLRRRLSLG